MDSYPSFLLSILVHLRCSTQHFCPLHFMDKEKLKVEKSALGASLVVWWLRLLIPRAGDMDSTRGQGIVSHTLQYKSEC